jgi:hypothetical protein
LPNTKIVSTSGLLGVAVLIYPLLLESGPAVTAQTATLVKGTAASYVDVHDKTQQRVKTSALFWLS